MTRKNGAMEVWVVHDWCGGIDSVWSSELEAKARCYDAQKSGAGISCEQVTPAKIGMLINRK